jgi:hypothetical protein
MSFNSSFDDCGCSTSYNTDPNYGNPLSPEAIKFAYESNPNTNAFTDAEKDKLGNAVTESYVEGKLAAFRATFTYVQEETPNVSQDYPTLTDAQGISWYIPSEGTSFIFYVDPDGKGQWVEEDSNGTLILGENIIKDFGILLRPYEVPEFNGNQFTLPYLATSLLVTINGRSLSPSDVEIANDGYTVTLLNQVVTTADTVVARSAFVDQLPIDSAYGGIVDNKVTDVNADISPIIKDIYNDGFKTLYIFGNYYIDRAVFDQNYSGMKIICYGKLTVTPSATEGGDGQAARSIWYFEGDGYQFRGLHVDVNNKRGLTGVLMQNCTNFKVHGCKFGNGGTSDDYPNLVSGLNIKSGKGGEVIGNTFYSYLPTGSASQSRGLSVDSVDGDPCEDIKFSHNRYINNNASCVVGFAKDCHWSDEYHLDTLKDGVSTRNCMYFVAYDADFQGGGCTVTNTQFVNCLQPFVTRCSNVSFKGNVMVDCSIGVGIDNSATPTNIINDITIEDNEFRMTEDSPNTAGAFMRTRAGHVGASGLVVKDNRIYTNLQFGSFLAFDSGNGRVDNSLFENNTVTCMLKDVVEQNLKFPIVFNEGTGNTFKNNSFVVTNLTGDVLDESVICTVRLPSEGGNDWIDNSMSTDDSKLFIRAENVFAGDSHVQDNINTLLGDFGGGVLQSKIYGAKAGRTVSAISGIFPRSGTWNSGDIVKRDAIVTRPLNYYPSNSDEYWLCIESGDYSDPDPANWPVWCANGDYSKQRVTIAPPTLLAPSSSIKGVDVLVQIDTTIKSNPNVSINSVVYELYEEVAGSFTLVDSRVSNNDMELFTGLTNGSKYRIDVYGRSKFFIDRGVPVGFNFTVDSNEPNDVLGSPTNITNVDAILESQFDSRVKAVNHVTDVDYTIQVLDYADSDFEKMLYLGDSGGILRMTSDGGTGAVIEGITLGGTWNVIASFGTVIAGTSVIQPFHTFTIKRLLNTWYVQITPIDYVPTVSGTFLDGNSNTISVTNGDITDLGV